MNVFFLTVQMWGHWLSILRKKSIHQAIFLSWKWTLDLDERSVLEIPWILERKHTHPGWNFLFWWSTENVPFIPNLWGPKDFHLLSHWNNYLCWHKDFSTCWQRSLCKTSWKTILVTNENKEGDLTIQLPNNLGIMTLQLPLRGTLRLSLEAMLVGDMGKLNGTKWANEPVKKRRKKKKN